MDTFKNHLHLPVTKIDDSERMLARLKVQHLLAQQRLASPSARCAAMKLAQPSMQSSMPIVIVF